MNFNNAYMIYLVLMEKHNPGRKRLSLFERIKESAHFLLQEGPKTRKQKPEHLSPVRDLRNIHDRGCRTKKRKCTKGAVSAERSFPSIPVLHLTKLSKLKSRQEKNQWHKHQFMSCASTSGRCYWGKCPDFIATQAKGWI